MADLYGDQPGGNALGSLGAATNSFADSLDGTAGNDTLHGLNLDDTIFGLGGLDTLFGDSGNDTLDGDLANDKLFGGAGNDTLIGGAGADVLDGGAGADAASYQTAAAGVTVNRATNVHTGDAAGDTFVSIEAIKGSDHADVMTGSNSLADSFFGGDGADTLMGGSGDDRLWGDAGADTLNGAAGTDHANYDNSALGVAVDLNLAVQADPGTDADGDELISIESVHGSLVGANFLVGTDGVGEHLKGGNAGDLLIGNGGADHLEALDGDDFLVGGGGNDTLQGDAGSDTASFFDEATGKVIVNLTMGSSPGIAFGPDIGVDKLVGVENVVVGDTGSRVNGSAADNTMIGGLGNDTFNGFQGDDFLFGSSGDNVLNGAAGNDVLESGDGDDRLYGGSGNDFIDAGGGGDTALGGAGDDEISGGGGNDLLLGDLGNDTIDGGAGNDALRGGAGVDVFVFAPGYEADTILDFTKFDKLDLTGFGFGGFSDVLALPVVTFFKGFTLDFGGGDMLTVKGQTYGFFAAHVASEVLL
ncbi:MAG: calcium-binding protein [Rhodospirillales bacterium]